MSPVCVFESQSQLDETLYYWQNKLFLNDWIITAEVASLREIGLDDRCGENELDVEGKVSHIRILSADDFPDDYRLKICQEKILVHELLHCKLNLLSPDDSFESRFYDMFDHQRLEELAKTLIMVKYNLHFNWFRK